MSNFKDLQWQIDDDGYIVAKPDGLKWSYYISYTNGYFELALIDEYGNSDNRYTSRHSSILETYLKAKEHYLSILLKHIIL